MRTAREIIAEAFKLHEQERLDEAEYIYDRVLGSIVGIGTPDEMFNALQAYGTLLAAQEKKGVAAFLLQCALGIYQNHAPVWTNLAICLKDLDRTEAAKAAWEKALELEPTSYITLADYASLFINNATPEEAERISREALKYSPEHPEAHNHLALALLEQGRFEEAWPHWEYRWSLRRNVKNRRPYKAPRWTGEKVKTLAVHGEQGVGDEILYLSCLREAQKRADRVILECTKKLVPWLSKIAPVYPDHASLIEAEGEPDAYVPMGSLPEIVGLPDGKPYLPRPCAPIKGRVGFTWRGGLQKTHKGERSLKQEWLAPILEVPGYEFVSVQYDPDRSFDEINETIASCEILISVCQTAVHQAGAMGIPVWVLTPHKCAWRYSPVFGDKMLWYESAKLYRQGEDLDWKPVIQRVADDLRRRVLR